MKSETVLRDYSIFAREILTTATLAALFLVAGCGSSSNYTPRAELAPPPPVFQTAMGDYFGPPVPVEIALLQSLQDILPAAGDEEEPIPAKCLSHSSFSQEQGRVDFGFGDRPVHDSDLSFARVYSSRDAAEMTVRYTMALPSVKKAACR